MGVIELHHTFPLYSSDKPVSVLGSRRLFLPYPKAMNLVLKLFVVALALIAGFFASDVTSLISQHTKAIDLSQYCELSTKTCQQQNVSMVLSQDTAHPLIANRMSVDWPETSASQLTLTLQGVEMEMGIVKFVLNKMPSGQFEVDIILPVCTDHSMTWAGELSDGKTAVLPAIRME